MPTGNEIDNSSYILLFNVEFNREMRTVSVGRSCFSHNEGIVVGRILIVIIKSIRLAGCLQVELCASS